jgi:Domain of unknown function (DUF1995)
MAVEFCISLARCLKGKSEILVRDKKTLDTVTKVLDARERSEEEDLLDDEDDLDDEEDDDDDDDEDDGDDDNDNPLGGDDDDEIDFEGNVDSFRQKLMSAWDGSDAAVTPNEMKESDSSSTSYTRGTTSKRRRPPKRYRLASLFGSARISITGPDMPQDVVRAVRNNAMLMEDEENMIILSAVGQDEMVAVRALVEKYQKDKKMILVNCQFPQIPRELQIAETVYSILPLVVKEKETGRNFSVRGDEDGYSKVVVLRRYPKDWEIFVDVGNGFELVETSRIRPTMQAVTECLQRYLKSI